MQRACRRWWLSSSWDGGFPCLRVWPAGLCNSVFPINKVFLHPKPAFAGSSAQIPMYGWLPRTMCTARGCDVTPTTLGILVLTEP